MLSGELLAHGLGADPEPLQCLRRRTLAGRDQGQQELLGAGAVKAKPIGLQPRQ